MRNAATWLLWIATALQFGCAGLYLWSARLARRRAALCEEAFEGLAKSVCPALAFCAALRDDPGAPDAVRQHAAAVIPNNDWIRITSVPLAQDSGRVH